MAGAAAIGLERRVGFQLQFHQQRAEEEVGAAARIDEHRVAAEPAQPGAARELPLEHGARVHVGARRGQRPPRLRLDEPQQLQQPGLHHPVVVAPPRIPRDHAVRRVDALVARFASRVRVRHDDRAPQRRPRGVRPQPPLHGVRAREVGHLAVVTARQPAAVRGGVLARLDAGDPDRAEPQLPRPVANRPGQHRRRRRRHVRISRPDTLPPPVPRPLPTPARRGAGPPPTQASPRRRCP